MDQGWEELFEKYPEIKKDHPLKDETTLKIGGPCSGFIEVKSQKELLNLIKDVKVSGISYLVIGGGSNLLVSDSGFEGLVIKITFSEIKENAGDITVSAGTSLQVLVDYTINHGLDGMSTMTGIPGSVGGAIYGSAGAYGDNIRDFLKEVSYFDGAEVKKITRQEYETGYRDSLFKNHKDYIILEVSFSGLPQADTVELKAEALKILEKRQEKYPPDTKCPGSFFKNIPVEDLSQEQIKQTREVLTDFGKDPDYLLRFGKIPAGVLLEIIGANGDQLGQIKIAKNHGNTFFNLGNGTAEDFFNLAKKWKYKVKEKFGVELKPEVQLINLPSL